jgi:hypothetical protein
VMTLAASKYRSGIPPCPRKESGMAPGNRVATRLYPKAVPVPTPTSVNMFGLRCAMDCAMRRKKGQPAQRTTGAESASSSHAWAPGESRRCRRWPGSMSAMATTNTGSVSTAPIRKRRVMSRSSWFSGSAAVGTLGSSAMPQRGQLPGPT